MLNIEHTLFPYQERDMNLVVEALHKYRKVLFQANTGYGKTYAFCTVSKWYIHNHKKKVLILCHREELIEQTVETLTKMGITSEKIVANKRKYHHNSDVYVGMEETVFNRLEKNKRFFYNLGMVVADECHLKHFNKHLEAFSEQRVLGFTATPVYTEKETFYKCDLCSTEYAENTMCHNQETIEWSRPLTMSKFYDTIVVGTNVSELIEFGQIVKDDNNAINIDISSLQTNSRGEFTEKSLTKTYGNEEVVFNVLENYEKICKGQRTIIFNPSSKVNLAIYEQFKEKCYNIKLYDSVNDTESSRKEIVNWFKSTDDAILTNVNCFSVGFDSRDVQAVIVNRATLSLSLWLQMVGRGARSSENIFKDKFIVIDLGGNIDRHGVWSDPTRDWERIFYYGIGEEKAKIEQLEAIRECVECGGYTSKRNTKCDVCGFVEEKKVTEKRVVLSDEIARPIEPPKPPNSKKIIEFVERKGGDMNMAFKIFIEQILMLFRLHQVTKGTFEKTLDNGNFDDKVGKMARSFYFVAIKSGLEQRKNVKLQTFLDKVKRKVAELYN